MGEHIWMLRFDDQISKVEVICTQCSASAKFTRSDFKMADDGPRQEAIRRQGILPTCEEEKVRQVMES